MDRQEGYYWVKKYPTSKHEIAIWNSKYMCWELTGNCAMYSDKDFNHINEVRIKEPGELPD